MEYETDEMMDARDAKRYRWLREQVPITICQAFDDETAGRRPTYEEEQQALDALVDYMMLIGE